MSDKTAQRLQKMNRASKRGITIRSSHMSLQDMILERSDEYPFVSHLDSFDCSNKFHEIDLIRDYNKMYRVRSPYRLVPAGPGDRSCHWRPDALCIYKDAIVAGLRFPFHEFIPRLLADVGINPCQLPPNAWRIIMCFIFLCLKNNFLLSVALFRKKFQFKNSSAITLGWVYINHRPSTPPIFHPKSIPDNNPKWKEEFMYLVWEGGDWGTLFRSSFSRVSDGSPSDIILSDEEAHAYAELTKDNYATMAWVLLDEFQLKSLGLSNVSDKAAVFINKTNEPEDGETARMKRARLGAKDPRASSVPAFIRPHVDLTEDAEGPASGKSAVWRPNWGLRKKDTVVGVSKHVVEWSYHSLTPCDYKDFVSNSTIEGVEHAGSQAMAALNANYQGALFQAKSWRSSSEANQGKFEKSQEEMASVKATLARKEKELADSQAELVSLRKGKDDFIDEYLDSSEYEDLIDKHDELLFPVQYTKGWDDALSAVLEKMPGSLLISDFPSPHLPTPLEMALAGEDEMEEDDRILDLDHTSPPGQTAGADDVVFPSREEEEEEEDVDKED
ncbi:hypothetical protein POM88_000602 [Heracleum sosnowskyi]|uniref:Transposase (putative) gypsy type domain-containing protein n=1 Tax=Heracleum sosnowskyi TaxID=360622 RepID=A0AAD8N9J9_9APIA|nr:hypothetical protein POM88_000602 [Heracleum sosnowskyi]